VFLHYDVVFELTPAANAPTGPEILFFTPFLLVNAFPPVCTVDSPILVYFRQSVHGMDFAFIG